MNASFRQPKGPPTPRFSKAGNVCDDRAFPGETRRTYRLGRQLCHSQRRMLPGGAMGARSNAVPQPLFRAGGSLTDNVMWNEGSLNVRIITLSPALSVSPPTIP